MNKNRFLLAIAVLLTLNLVALVVHTAVLRGRAVCLKQDTPAAT